MDEQVASRQDRLEPATGLQWRPVSGLLFLCLKIFFLQIVTLGDLLFLGQGGTAPQDLVRHSH